MKKNKKALTTSTIIMLILAIITLVYMITLFFSYSELAEIKTNELNCNQFFSTKIATDNIFFTETYDKPSLFFEKSITEICPSKSIEVTKKSVNNAIDLINSCYSMTGKGKDILGTTNMKNQAICLYCGEIKTDDTINNFNELLSKRLKLPENKHLFENSEALNTNKVFLDSKNLPKEVSKEKSLSVFYYIYRPDYDVEFDSEADFDIGAFTEFSVEFYAERLGVFFNSPGTVNEILALAGLGTQSLSGIVLFEQDRLTDENLLEEKIKIPSEFNDCILYVPLTHKN